MEGEVDMAIGGVHHRTIGPNGFFGVTSMLDGRPAVATVVTRTPIQRTRLTAAPCASPAAVSSRSSSAPSQTPAHARTSTSWSPA